MSVLTGEQERAYQSQGYLLVSGLIPAGVSQEAEAAMWRLLGIDPSHPDRWSDVPSGHQVFEDPALLACFTPEYLSAAAALAREPVDAFEAPRQAYAINVFPQEGSWHWPKPHIDHAIKAHGHKVFPRAFRVASMVFLSDVAPRGGGTIVWPDSPQKLERLARSDPSRYETMWALNQDLDRADLGEPVELVPRRGDVLFYHYLCAHSGSSNTSERPRFALNRKW